MRRQTIITQYFLHLFSLLIFISALLLPDTVFAHELQLLQIGNQDYFVRLGFANEVAFVNNKEEFFIDFRLLEKSLTSLPQTEQEDRTMKFTRVPELWKTLRVEVKSGNTKKELRLFPYTHYDGLYHVDFFPTVSDTYSFRIFGTINGIPVEITTECTRAETHQKASDAHPTADFRKEISPNVILKSKGRGFSCPFQREDAEFPVSSTATLFEKNLRDMKQKLNEIEQNISQSSRARDIFYFTLGTMTMFLLGAGIFFVRRFRNSNIS